MTWNDHGGEFAGKELWAKTMQLIGAQVNAYQGSSTVKKAHKNQFSKTTYCECWSVSFSDHFSACS